MVPVALWSELERVFETLGVKVQESGVGKQYCALGDHVALVHDVFFGVVPNARRENRIYTKHLFNTGANKRQIAHILKGGQAIWPDNLHQLFLGLFLYARICSKVEHEAIQRRSRGLKACFDESTRDPSQVLFCESLGIEGLLTFGDFARVAMRSFA